MKVFGIKTWLASVLAILFLTVVAQAQVAPQSANAHAGSSQAVATSLASLPEADAIIYFGPQRILNEAGPKVVPAADLAKLRATFVDWKKTIGIDPASIDFVAIAIRFQKPAADLSFVPPDLLAVVGGDFSADSLLTLASLYVGDGARTEKYGSKTLTLMKIDSIAQAAEKNPLLKSFAELGVVALNSNTIALGSIDYVKAAVDAADGNGRISEAALNSLLRNPNALVSAAGSPLTAFAKSFGLLGTQTTPREARCDTRFGDFYAAITMDGSNFNLRGATNADNPETAKIINGLVSGLLQPAISSIPDKDAQAFLKTFRMLTKENEIVWEADVSEQTVATFIREQMKPKDTTATAKKPVPQRKRRPRRKN